jgi:outer membrane protein assembly factor BamC
VGDVRLVRDGPQRWLVTPMTPEALWPQLRAFWLERGFTLDVDSPDAGVMETGWAENRAKIPQDWLRSSIGRVFEGAWDTGTRDRFRTRVERGAAGTEIYLTHRGMEEVLANPGVGTADTRTIWRPRPSDPDLEAELMARLMVKLGPSEASARAAVGPVAGAAPAPGAAASAPRAGAATVASTGTSLGLGEGFDRAWRRVGTALDRIGFTIEDRDRAAGVYFVRYVDPATVAGEEPGFWSKLFGRDQPSAPVRVRLQVKGEGQRSVVAVQNAQGAPETGDIAKRIIGALAAEINK